MHADTLKTPRAAKPTASHTMSSPLTPNDVRQAKPSAFERAIAAYVKRGGCEDDARRILAEEVATFTPGNLSCSLLYHGFARSAEAARKLADELTTERKTIFMSWAEWAGTPREYRVTRMGSDFGRWVLRDGPQGTTFYPVHITG